MIRRLRIFLFALLLGYLVYWLIFPWFFGNRPGSHKGVRHAIHVPQ